MYELNSQKIIEFATKTTKKDPELHKNREIFGLIMAPSALIHYSGVYYLTTKKMEPVLSFENYRYTAKTDMVTVFLHPMFPTKEGKLSFQQVAQYNFVATVEEMLEQWTHSPVTLSQWMPEENAAKWTSFLLLTSHDKPDIIK